MTLGRTTAGAIKIKTEGGLRAVSCSCCETGECSDYVEFQEYHWWDECPNTSAPCGGDSQASCSGATITGFLESKSFPKSKLNGKTPKADVYAYLDNFGSIGSLEAPVTDECVISELTGTVDPEVVDQGEFFYMRVQYTCINAPHGGPYGIICNACFKFV